MNETVFASLMTGIVVSAVVTAIAMAGTARHWERQAVAHGAGVYVLNASNGSTVFRWNDELEDEDVQ